MTAGGLDWAGLMTAGLQGLGLQPDQFWRLTPAELSLMLGQGRGQQSMARAALDELMQAFPDAERDTS